MRINNSSYALNVGQWDYNPFKILNTDNIQSVATQLVSIQNTEMNELGSSVAIQNAANELKSIAGQFNDPEINKIFLFREPSYVNKLAAQPFVSKGASLQDYTILTQVTATPQTNTGISLANNENSFSNEETTINISTKNTTTEIKIDTNTDKTNKEILTQAASEINKANLGISAEVKQDKKSDTSKLIITSDNTGKSSAFNISDLKGSFSSASGIDKIETKSENAVYSINGSSLKESESNKIKIDDKVSVELKSPGTFSFKVDYDKEQIKSKVSTMLDKLNNFIEKFDNNKENLSSLLNHSVNSMIDKTKKNFSNIGINFENNKFSITDTFNQLLDDTKKVDTKIKRTLSDVGKNIDTKMESITQSPAYLITKNKTNDSYNFSSISNLPYLSFKVLDFLQGIKVNSLA